MGGLSKDLKIVFLPFAVGSLALAGFPFLSGFWSKDEIVGNALVLSEHQGGAWTFVFAVLAVTAFLTAFYTTRMVMMTFFGAPYVAEGHGAMATEGHGHGHAVHAPDRHDHASDNPDEHGHVAHHDAGGHAGGHRHLHMPHWTMSSVLWILAVLAAFGGLALGSWWSHALRDFLEPVFTTPEAIAHLDHEAVHHTHETAMVTSSIIALAGIFLGWLAYGPLRSTLDAIVAGPLAVFRRAAEDKFYVDEAYDVLVVKPVNLASQGFFKVIDRLVIDGLLVEGSGKAVMFVGSALRRTQSGAVSAATGATLIGTVAVLLWVVLHG
jgi:NADH-quinone oxidoreductase subunit L